MSDADRPSLRIGAHVVDCKDDEFPDEDVSVMLVVELTLERADAIYMHDGE